VEAWEREFFLWLQARSYCFHHTAWLLCRISQKIIVRKRECGKVKPERGWSGGRCNASNDVPSAAVRLSILLGMILHQNQITKKQRSQSTFSPLWSAIPHSSHPSAVTDEHKTLASNPNSVTYRICSRHSTPPHHILKHSDHNYLNSQNTISNPA
jgi:hypothetical protein